MMISIRDDDGLSINREIDGKLLELVIDEEDWLTNEFKTMLRKRREVRDKVLADAELGKADGRNYVPRETDDERGR